MQAGPDRSKKLRDGQQGREKMLNTLIRETETQTSGRFRDAPAQVAKMDVRVVPVRVKISTTL